MRLVASVRPSISALTTELSAAKSNNHHYQSKAFVCVPVHQWPFADNRAWLTWFITWHSIRHSE